MALVPNAILGAMFWFGTANPPAQQSAAPAPTVQTVLPAVLTAPPTIEAKAGEEIGFPIALDGTDGVPRRSVIAIAGLPLGSLFSDGRPYGETEWNLSTDQIGDLRLTLPEAANGDAKLAIRLIAPDGAVIADAETILKVTPAAIEQAPPDGSEAVLAAIPTNAGAEQTLPPAPVEAAIAPAGEVANAPAETGSITPPEESVKPQSTAPEKAESDQTETDGADWVTPSAYVNLRDGPSSSSQIIGVVAKGVKVEVSDRKRGWLAGDQPGDL